MYSEQVILTEKETVGVYLLLRKQGFALDGLMSRLMIRMERLLYQRLTIEELECLVDDQQADG